MNHSFKSLIDLVKASALATILVAPAFASSITLTGTIRDFNYNNPNLPGPLTPHPDFESVIGSDSNIVTSTLGADGLPVYAGGSPTTTGATNFNQWFRDTPGVNLSTQFAITLNETTPGSGLFNYTNNSFFPIDNQLGGNQGFGHNFHFTYQIHTKFTYQAGQVFDFTGDDDVWVYINKQLVIDLGGVHGPESASVDLDDLGLTAGNLYDFDFFFAERHTSGSNLSITTSIPLITNPVPEAGSAVSYLLSFAALAALGLRQRSRR